MNRTLSALAACCGLLLVACNDAGAGQPATPPTTPPSGDKPAQAAPPPAKPAETKPADPKSEQSPKATPSGDPMTASPTDKPKLEKALFGAGCFWGVEYVFRKDVPGVVEAVCGYAGGKIANPTYERVCAHDTGHAEVVQVTFDPAKISYEKLVDAFFRLHDPTQVNRQGPDIGDQYRSVIFYYSPEQKQAAEKVKAARAPKYSKPIATSIEAAPEFYKAEDYHQKYYIKNGHEPYCHVLRPE